MFGAAVLAAFAATAAFVIPFLARIEEPFSIVVVSQILTLTKTTFIVAVTHSLLIGLPLFLLVRRMRSDAGIAACTLGGFVVAAIPIGVLALISMIGVRSASTNGTPTIVNGAPTLFGWIEYVRTIGLAGLLGLVGGLTFWAAMRLSGSAPDSPDKAGTKSNRSNEPIWRWNVVFAAVVLTCGIFVLPVIVRDRSCHNVFRDGRTSVGPQVYADLKVPAEDWQTLKQMFEHFGDAQALSVRSDEQLRDGRPTWRELDLCNDVGVSINVYDEPWLTRMHSPRADQGMRLSIFSLRPGPDWKPLARDLLSEIETTWPQKTTFRGPSGQILSFEDAMNGRQ